MCASANEESLTLWSKTTFSQVMSPTSSTTTTSQRQLKVSSRSPPVTPGPRTCMTLRSVTSPSAWRSLHHCFRSEKNQRAVEKLVTLLKKVYCHVSRSLSVGHVRTGRLVNEFGSLSSCVRENPCRDSEYQQIRILLDDKRANSRMIVEHRFKTSSKSVMTEEVSKN